MGKGSLHPQDRDPTEESDVSVHWRTLRCLAVAGALLGATLPASAAYADSVFHSARYELRALGGAPLSSGFVIDVHAYGPRVYAQERYHLKGALPSTEYEVTLLPTPTRAARNCSRRSPRRR